MKSIKKNAYGESDIGLQRSKNEDAYMIDFEHGVYAVADGLGGLPQGELASSIAVASLRDHIHENEKLDNFKEIFLKIAQTVKTVGREIDEDFGIATTLTALKIDGDRCYMGHIGDSGLIVFRKSGGHEKFTRDDTMAQDIRDSMKPGETCEVEERFNHILTQCLGKEDKPEIQTDEFKVEPGDRILLYTDGVTKAFDKEELEALIFEQDDPIRFVQKILEEANNRGGVDNTTAIAIFVD